MDVLANMLNTIKTGAKAGKESVFVPFSNFKKSVAKALLDAGYIASYEKRDRTKGGDMIEIVPAYDKNGKPVMQQVKRISKPSRRMYVSVKDIRTVRNGFGKVFISTPKGVMTGQQARKEHVGGEILFEVF